ncbi:MAG: DUF5677 domain-containing protein [Candidatus Celaenobacter antarcticus]|nr:DUF5677 domain-containing protein [Candidatus Celaenobacter antarcticus]
MLDANFEKIKVLMRIIKSYLEKLNSLWIEFDKLGNTIFNEILNLNKMKVNKILAFTFALKIRNSCNSINLLLNNSLIHDSKSILRTMAEASVYFIASISDEEFMKQFHLEELDRKRRVLNKLLEVREIEKNENIDDLLKHKEMVRNEIKSFKKEYKKETLKKLSIKYNMHNFYYYLDNACSSQIHSLPCCMEEYLKVSDDDQLISFYKLPDLKDTKLVYTEALNCYSLVIIKLNKTFSLSHGKKINEVKLKLKEIIDSENQKL